MADYVNRTLQGSGGRQVTLAKTDTVAFDLAEFRLQETTGDTTTLSFRGADSILHARDGVDFQFGSGGGDYAGDWALSGESDSTFYLTNVASTRKFLAVSATTLTLGNATDLPSITLQGDTTIAGNLNVNGTTTSISSQEVLISDNHVVLNSGYMSGVAQTGGLVVNTLPEATVDTAAAGGFTAGSMGVSNPTLATVGAATYSVGDIIQISGANNPTNNGIFEVLSHAANVLEIRGVGLTGTVEDFTQTQFVTDSTVAGDVTLINVSVMRAGTDGAWEVAYGKTTGLVFTDLSVGGGGTGTDNLTWTINADNIGANENAALYMKSGNGTAMRQGQITTLYDGGSSNVMNFDFNSAAPATEHGFGFIFTPNSGGNSSGATAAGQGGGFTLYGAGGGTGDVGGGGGLTGDGGTVSLSGGIGGTGSAAVAGGNGGTVTIYGGMGGMAPGGTNGNGGGVTLYAGNAPGGGGTGAGLTLGGGITGTGDGLVSLSGRNITISSSTTNYINPSSGDINIGTTAVGRNVNVGTGAAAEIVTVGSTNSTSSLTLDAGTGAINMGTSAAAKTITIGNGTGATSVVVDAGTGNIDIGANAFARTVNVGTGGDSTAQVVTVGSTSGASSLTLRAGSGGMTLTSTTGTAAINAAGQLLNIDAATATLDTSSTLDVTSLGDATWTVKANSATALSFDNGSVAFIVLDTTTALKQVEFAQFVEPTSDLGVGVQMFENAALTVGNIVYAIWDAGDGRTEAAKADADGGGVMANVFGVVVARDGGTSTAQINTMHGAKVPVLMGAAPAATDNGKVIFLDTTAGQGTLTAPVAGDVVALGTLIGGDGADTTPLVIWNPQFRYANG